MTEEETNEVVNEANTEEDKAVVTGPPKEITAKIPQWLSKKKKAFYKQFFTSKVVNRPHGSLSQKCPSA